MIIVGNKYREVKLTVVMGILELMAMVLVAVLSLVNAPMMIFDGVEFCAATMCVWLVGEQRDKIIKKYKNLIS